ncbi:MAG: pentapeptide repeat-containing protein [Nanoarchaeota archaeon]
MALRRIDLTGGELVNKILEGERDFSGIELESGFNFTEHHAFDYITECFRSDGGFNGGLNKKNPLIFSGAKLCYLKADGIYLPYGKFDGADLTGASFDEADLSEADFSRAKLWYASFFRARLTKSNFTKAKCNRTDFRETDLKEAWFIGSEFKNVYLQNAKLDDANFDKTRFDGFLVMKDLYRARRLPIIAVNVP